MPDTPRAEVNITTILVEELLRAQHPDLAHLDLQVVAEGWDNITVKLGEALAVRLPRRELSSELVRHEQRCLPSIADRVSVAVPAPIRTGEPTSSYPWAWSIVPWFEGVSALSVDQPRRAPVAAALGQFLAELHTLAPANAPHNPFRGVPLADRDEDVRRRLRSGAVPEARELERTWDAAIAAPGHQSGPRWLHGDLHPGNLVVAATAPHALHAVIDFGDVCAGDPATDLATAWLTFDRLAREEFCAVVTTQSGIAIDAWQRAIGWAVVMASALVESSDDHPAHRELGLETIDAILDDSPRLFR